MCGFVGSLELGENGTERSAIESMTASLVHRGPDGSGIEEARPVVLGHRRLRIIDLSERADQPMWNERHDLAIVFNGEIYNFRELREELDQSGAHFRTESDTEVILQLYDRLGDRALPRLDGMFALALWDTKKNRLLLARDRAGKKPLFYYQDSERVVFGSEIKSLHRHPRVPREPHLEALPFYLTYGYFPAPLTPYRRVQALSPATWMTVDGDGVREIHRYWTPRYEVNGIRHMDEAVERLRPLVTEAVRKRLVSDVPLGAFLSGGLDSTIVVGLMSELGAKPLKTFSIGFENAPEYDELDYAEEAALRFGSEHVSLKVAPPKPELFELLVHHHDGPFGDSSAIPTYAVSELARREVTVVLNGDGGDELFCGYSRLAAAALSERIPGPLRELLAIGGRFLPAPRSHAGTLRRVQQFLEISRRPLRERIQAWCSLFRGPELETLLRHRFSVDPGVHFERFFSESEGGSPMARLLYLTYCTYLPEDLLVKMDRMSMAHGLKARSPFLDTALAEFAGQLPDSFKARGFNTKLVLREAFRDLVPPRILKRRKMGFGIPLGPWFRGELCSFVESHLVSGQSPLFEHLDREMVVSYVNEHMEGRRDRGHQLFSLLTLSLWLRSF